MFSRPDCRSISTEPPPARPALPPYPSPIRFRPRRGVPLGQTLQQAVVRGAAGAVYGMLAGCLAGLALGGQGRQLMLQFGRLFVAHLHVGGRQRRAEGRVAVLALGKAAFDGLALGGRHYNGCRRGHAPGEGLLLLGGLAASGKGDGHGRSRRAECCRAGEGRDMPNACRRHA